MWFWVSWEMWQKLCFALACILIIVLIYSFGVLIYNRHKLGKHAAAEAYERDQHDAELRPMLTCGSEIPFGARALERGVQIEGIWVSSNDTLDQIPKEPKPTFSPPSTPITGSPLKKTSVVDVSESQDSMPKYPSASHTASSPGGMTGIGVAEDELTTVKSNVQRPNHRTSYQSSRTFGTHRNSMEPGSRISRQWFGPRSSWITKAATSSKRQSAISQETPRQSSEEIRRRFSKLFDEQLEDRPAETFQLTPVNAPTVDTDKRQSKSFKSRFFP